MTYVSQPNNGTYQTCACEWADGQVISMCAAHYAWVHKIEDRLAEKYRKLTEGK